MQCAKTAPTKTNQKRGRSVQKYKATTAQYAETHSCAHCAFVVHKTALCGLSSLQQVHAVMPESGYIL
jgi:polyferredoxin